MPSKYRLLLGGQDGICRNDEVNINNKIERRQVHLQTNDLLRIEKTRSALPMTS